MPLKILIIQGGVNKKLPSGEQTVILNESIYLSKENNVNIEYIEKETSFFGRLTGLIWSFSNYKKVKKFIEKYKPNIVHFHTVVPYLSLSVFFAAKQKNIKVVQTLHNGRWICVEGGFVRKGKYCKKCVGNIGFYGAMHGCNNGVFASTLLVINNIVFRYLQKKYKLVDKFIAISDFIREKHIKTGFYGKSLIVNNNGIDNLLIKKIIKTKNVKPKTSEVVFAGKVSYAKGVEILKYVISKAKYQKFHIIGDGPNLNELKKFTKNNNYNKVKFWGKQNYQNTLKIISEATCVIVPSQMGEPFGLVAVEAMALGVPVVSSNRGELKNLVSQGGGMVVNARNFDQFKKSIDMYIENPNKAKLMGLKGLKFVKKNLLMKSKVKILTNIYKSL